MSEFDVCRCTIMIPHWKGWLIATIMWNGWSTGGWGKKTPLHNFQWHIATYKYNPVNTIHWPNAGLMLGRRRRRRANINPALGRCIMFVGKQNSPAEKWVTGTKCGGSPGGVIGGVGLRENAVNILNTKSIQSILALHNMLTMANVRRTHMVSDNNRQVSLAEALTLTTLNYLCIIHGDLRFFFNLKIIINVLVSSFRFI